MQFTILHFTTFHNEMLVMQNWVCVLLYRWTKKSTKSWADGPLDCGLLGCKVGRGLQGGLQVPGVVLSHEVHSGVC